MFEELMESASEFSKRKKDMALSALSDFLFLFTYGAATFLILNKIREYAIKAFNIIQQNESIVRSANTDLFSIMSSLPGFDAAFNSVLIWIAILMLCVFLTYASIQYFSWRIISKDKSFKFMKSFALLSLLWTVVYFIITFFKNAKSFFFMIQNTPETKTILFSILFFILAYLAAISYSAISIRSKKKFKTLRLAFRLKSIYSLIELAALFFVLDLLVAALNIISQYASLIIGSIILLILISFSKLHILRTVQNQKI